VKKKLFHIVTTALKSEAED